MTRRTSQLMTLAAALFALVVIVVPVIAAAQYIDPVPRPLPTSTTGPVPTTPLPDQAAAASGGGGFSLFGIGDIASKVVGWTTFVIGYIIATIGGVVINFIAYFIQILLQISTFIPKSIAVEEGFKVFLSLANLTFVFGIIVIALATIVRYQTYGIKQLLWKLIVMAVAVNFSMAIVSTIMTFSDGLTLYLLGAMKQPSISETAEQNFASALAGAFQPQALFLSNGMVRGGSNIVDPTTLASAGSNLATSLKGIINVFFVVAILISIIITLGSLAVMLIIRYLYLTILLIVMPLAWAGWVFPAMRGWWSQWWNKFVQQVFFPPAVVFFLYLTIRTSEGMRNVGNTSGARAAEGFLYQVAHQPGSELGILKGAQTLVGSFVGEFAGTLFQALVVVGLSLGGLFAAKKLNVEFAGKALAGAEGAVKSFGGYVGRRARGSLARSATAPKPEAKQGLRGRLQRLNPMNGVRAIVQSDLAKSYGVTKAVEKYGNETDLAQTRNIRLAAKEKFRQAKEATDPELQKRLREEAGALASLAAKRRVDSPGLFASITGAVGKGTGLWKSEKKSVSGPESETLKNLGQARETTVKETVTETKEVPILGADQKPLLGPDGQPLTKTVTETKTVEKKVPLPSGPTLSGRAQKGIAAAQAFGARAKGGTTLTKEQAEMFGISIEGEAGEGTKPKEEPLSEEKK